MGKNYRNSSVEASAFAKDVKERMIQAIMDAGYTMASFTRRNGIGDSLFYSMALPNVLDVVLVSEKTGVSTDYLLKGDGLKSDEFLKGEKAR